MTDSFSSIRLAVQADQEYAAAFREAGIDVDALSVKEAVDRITARRAIAAALLPALDDWVAVRSVGKDEAATRRLIDVLHARRSGPVAAAGAGCLGPQGLAGFGQSRDVRGPGPAAGGHLDLFIRGASSERQAPRAGIGSAAGSVEIPGRLLDQPSLGCGPDLAAVAK